MAEGDPAALPRVTARQEALPQFGWTVGQNIKIDYRWGAANADRFRHFASELVSLSPEIVLGTGMLALAALRNEIRTIPILIVLVVDPVSTGFVASLPKPGGNITGFANFKWLELLKEVYLRLRRVLLILDPDTTPYASFLNLLDVSGAALAWQRTASARIH